MKIFKITVGPLATNCYVVASEKNNAFIIDPGDEALKIKDVIEKNKLVARFIVDTHSHIDHIKANAAFGLPVYIHEKERSMISDPKENLTTTLLGSFEPVVPAGTLND
ncbi:MAG TPA: MBL fold metallo-hydrolase, partial [Candidatus Omnitrophota bacterium]|nr:MBL fold metallo-hydrolase [Candidatus Omnitrophota bacterium]